MRRVLFENQQTTNETCVILEKSKAKIEVRFQSDLLAVWPHVEMKMETA